VQLVLTVALEISTDIAQLLDLPCYALRSKSQAGYQRVHQSACTQCIDPINALYYIMAYHIKC